MPDNTKSSTTDHDVDASEDAHEPEDQDGYESLVERMEKKFDKSDRADDDEGDGESRDDDDDDEEQDEGEVESADDSDDEDDAEHTDADTSADDPDGDDAESDADSDADDDAEHTDDESDSDDDAGSEDDADDSEGAKKDEDDDADAEDSVDETKAALAGAGADLTLADVPEKFRPIVEKKIKAIDSAFTRVMQEQTAFRAERAKLHGEERFRRENPALYFVEQIRKDPKLLEAVNAELDKLDPEGASDDAKAANAKALEGTIRDKRKTASDAVQKELDDQRAAYEKAVGRGEEVDALARKLSADKGVPYRIVEKAIMLVLKEREADRKPIDITNEEVKAIVDEEARELKGLVRKRERDESKKRVKDRAGNRRKASPATRTPSGAASPGGSRQKKIIVDHDNEESRLAAMDRSARRILSGK